MEQVPSNYPPGSTAWKVTCDECEYSATHSFKYDAEAALRRHKFLRCGHNLESNQRRYPAGLAGEGSCTCPQDENHEEPCLGAHCYCH